MSYFQQFEFNCYTKIDEKPNKSKHELNHRVTKKANEFLIHGLFPVQRR